MIFFRRQHVDPNTGDIIGRSEKFSLVAQWVMRRWSFIFAMTLLTALWWWNPRWFGDQPGSWVKWQLWASYMALLIESLVGIGMFGWARRDSVIIRKLYSLERQAEQRDEIITALLQAHIDGKVTDDPAAG